LDVERELATIIYSSIFMSLFGYLRDIMTGRNNNGRHPVDRRHLHGPPESRFPPAGGLENLQDDGSFCWQENEFSSFAWPFKDVKQCNNNNNNNNNNTQKMPT
jgi:hypothetical protein